MKKDEFKKLWRRATKDKIDVTIELKGSMLLYVTRCSFSKFFEGLIFLYTGEERIGYIQLKAVKEVY